MAKTDKQTAKKQERKAPVRIRCSASEIIYTAGRAGKGMLRVEVGDYGWTAFMTPAATTKLYNLLRREVTGKA